jgi:hypothetical protein
LFGLIDSETRPIQSVVLATRPVEKILTRCSLKTVKNRKINPRTNAMMNDKKPCILWSCVARNDEILAEASIQNEHYDEYVGETARLLFRKKETPGWEYATLSRRNCPKLKGIKFHVYDHTAEGDFHIWVFSCVYDPTSSVEALQVQSFIEKIVGISELFREHDSAWKYGSHLAAQDTFAPILLQRMEEVSYLGKHAMVNSQLDSLKSIMANNIEMILARGERIEKLQTDATRLTEMAAVFKTSAKKVKRQMLWQNAKHGLVLGTAITAGVAIVVIPPLVAVF